MKAIKILKEIKTAYQHSMSLTSYEKTIKELTIEIERIDKAIAELELLKCCQNCKHYSMFEGKWECKNCYAKDYTNWEVKE